jgi:hypothetical protein
MILDETDAGGAASQAVAPSLALLSLTSVKPIPRSAEEIPSVSFPDDNDSEKDDTPNGSGSGKALLLGRYLGQRGGSGS